MANLRVDTIKNQDGSAGPTFDGNLDFSSSAYTVLPKGTTAQRPTGIAAGSLRFNTDTKLVEQYNGVEWVTLNSYGVGRGVFGGGFAGGATIDYITISTTGNAQIFGYLTDGGVGDTSACSSSTRGVCGGGYGYSPTNIIQYITIATTGNATDFGDLTLIRHRTSACSSSTRGLFSSGEGGGQTNNNVIDYITIATTGNATDFGDLTQSRNAPGGCSSSTRGIFGGGYTKGIPNIGVNTVDYITIATTGNATTFGDLTQSRGYISSCSSSTRGVFGGGFSPPTDYNRIDYITIATTGNATYFGDLIVARNGLSGCSSQIRGVFAGGYSPTVTNAIEYITISSLSNSISFGDLTVKRSYFGSLSDAHGGLS